MSTGLQPTAHAYMASGCLTGFFIAAVLSFYQPSLDRFDASTAQSSKPILSAGAAQDRNPKIDIARDPVFITTAQIPALTASTVTVRSGDTLLGVMQGAGIISQEAHTIISSLRRVFDPRDINIGQRISLRLVENSGGVAVDSLRIDIGPGTDIIAYRAPNGDFESHTLIAPTESVAQAYAGTINTSLYDAAVSKGVPPPFWWR